MSKHTKTPWQYERIPSFVNPPIDGFQIISATPSGIDTMTVAVCPDTEQVEANARRIVACVNACEGIGTEYLEHFGGTSFNDFKRVKGQRDELRETLTALVEGLEKTHWSSWQTTARFDDELRAARNFLNEGEQM